jgi:hypothetical protein
MELSRERRGNLISFVPKGCESYGNTKRERVLSLEIHLFAIRKRDSRAKARLCQATYFSRSAAPSTSSRNKSRDRERRARGDAADESGLQRTPDGLHAGKAPFDKTKDQQRNQGRCN